MSRRSVVCLTGKEHRQLSERVSKDRAAPHNINPALLHHRTTADIRIGPKQLNPQLQNGPLPSRS